MIARSPTVWYSTITIDKGSDQGVRVNQPVVSGGGLVGKVSDVAPDASRVTLITDHTSGVSAQVVPDGANGIVKATVGNPSDLILDFVQKGRPVPKGATWSRPGWRSSRLESLFPRGIPIGAVTRSDSDERELYQRVHLRPYADLRELDMVEVLTRGLARRREAQVPVNVTPGTIVRIALLVLATVVLQIAVVTQIACFDADADLFPLVTLSVGLLAGPIAGATVGFLLGLVADMALLQTLGVTSLLLIGVGYLAGRYREMRDAIPQARPGRSAAFVATLAYATAFSLVQFLLGVESPVSPLVIREILVSALLNGLIAMPGVRGRARAAAARPDRRPAPAPAPSAPTRRGPLTGAPLRSSAVTITGPRRAQEELSQMYSPAATSA